MKKLLLILSILIGSVSVFGQNFEGFDDLKYVGTDTINGYVQFVLSNDDFTGTTKVSAIDTNLATELWVKDNIADLLPKYGIAKGGIVTWISGLTFNVSACKYYINSANTYTSPSTEVTLSAADTLDRIDVFAVDTSNQVIIIEGTPSANPQEPSVNVESQIRLTSVLIQANDTLPSPVTPGDTLIQYKVYDENVEWTTSAGGVTVNFASTTDVKVGTVSAEAQQTGVADFLMFTTSNGVPASEINSLSFWLRLKNTVSSGSLVAHFYNNSTWSGYATVPFANDTTWQHVAIDLSSMNFSIDSINKIQLLWNVSALDGFFVDDIRLQGGLVSVVISDTELTGNESAFDGWDKDVSDDFSGDYLELINKPDLSQYLMSETQSFEDVLTINNRSAVNARFEADTRNTGTSDKGLEWYLDYDPTITRSWIKSELTVDGRDDYDMQDLVFGSSSYLGTIFPPNEGSSTTDESYETFRLSATGQLKARLYGTGIFEDNSPVYLSGFDATGKFIEVDPSTIAGSTDHSLLTNLDYANSGHTGFVSTTTDQTIFGNKEFRDRVDIENTYLNLGNSAFIRFFSLLSDPGGQTSSAGNLWMRSSDKHLIFSNATEDFDLTAGGGTTDHALLTNLDYANSGHTGFAGTGVANTFTSSQTFESSTFFNGSIYGSPIWMGNFQLGNGGAYLGLMAGSSPGAGTSSAGRIWMNLSDKKLYFTNSTTTYDLTAAGGGTGDGYISNVSLSGTTLNFTGVLNGFNGSVDLSSLGGGSMVYPGAGIPVSTGSAWGTSITNNSNNWNDAYNNKIVSGSVTGTTTKTVTLNQQDGGSVSFNFTDIQGEAGGGLTSVGLSMPTGFSVSNSPLTVDGTLSVSFSSGYSLPTTSSQTNWTYAYNNSITGTNSTTTSTYKTYYLNQVDGGNVSFTINAATTSSAGLLNSTDKTAIDNLGSISTKGFWTGTQAQYDALGSYDSNTIYFIED